MNRSGIQHALFGTLPGRVIVISVAIRLGVYAVSLASGAVPVFLSVIDTVASIGLAIGAGYFAYKLILLGKRRLLWRVRRKLILSYVFIGFIPAALIVSFFLLSGFLLFYNFSSYLVQSRLSAIADQAKFLAQSTALEIQRDAGRDAAAIIRRRQDNADDEFPGLSVAVVPVDLPCSGGSARAPSPLTSAVAAGPWEHVAPPPALPRWITCDGFAGVLAYSRNLSGDELDGIVLRAVALPDAARATFAVICDIPVSAAVKERLRSETGVSISSFTMLRDRPRAQPAAGKDGTRADAQPLASRPGGASTAAAA
ncbi:MAG TPA: hypothetical protein VLV86_19085, partial [Vicinamibacterales bacterium]|nr:hypothetical protein [Vicinamibacterales bacterium]